MKDVDLVSPHYRKSSERENLDCPKLKKKLQLVTKEIDNLQPCRVAYCLYYRIICGYYLNTITI